MGNSAAGSRNRVRANGPSARRDPDKLPPGRVRLLEEAGFTYDGQMEAWLNIAAGRVIAFDRVANRSPEWLATWLGLSRAHPLFVANGHDVRTVRSGSPALVLVSDDNTPAPRPLRVGRRRRSFGALPRPDAEMLGEPPIVFLIGDRRRERWVVEGPPMRS